MHDLCKSNRPTYCSVAIKKLMQIMNYVTAVTNNWLNLISKTESVYFYEYCITMRLYRPAFERDIDITQKTCSQTLRTVNWMNTTLQSVRPMLNLLFSQ